MTRARLAFFVSVALGGLGLGLWSRSPSGVGAQENASPVAQAHATNAVPPEHAGRAGLPRGHAAASPTSIESDPLAALPSLTTQPPSSERNAAIAAVVTEIGRTDPTGALELAQALRNGMDDGTLEHRLQIWTEQAPAEAIAWVKSQPAGAPRDRLLARAAYVRVQTNPAEALELLQLMSADPANEPATQSVLKLWQQRDPNSAIAWLAQNPKA